MPISDSRGIVPRRLLRGLGAFAIAVTTGSVATPAFAQLDDYGGGYAYYGRGYERDYGYGPSRRFDYAPLPPAPIPPRAVERIAMREFGLVEVQRTVRTRSAVVVDGQVANGSHVRLILDRYSGDLIDRIVLRPAPPRTVRLDPREEQQPAAKKLAPRPPEKPAALKPAKPAGQASAPATVVPPSPAAPQPDAAPAKPAPLPAAAPKEIGSRLVNPQDVRGSDEPERAPPLARAQPGGIPTPDASLPPVQIEETRRAEPAPATEIVPVTPH